MSECAMVTSEQEKQILEVSCSCFAEIQPIKLYYSAATDPLSADLHIYTYMYTQACSIMPLNDSLLQAQKQITGTPINLHYGRLI